MNNQGLNNRAAIDSVKHIISSGNGVMEPEVKQIVDFANSQIRTIKETIQPKYQQEKINAIINDSELKYGNYTAKLEKDYTESNDKLKDEYAKYTTLNLRELDYKSRQDEKKLMVMPESSVNDRAAEMMADPQSFSEQELLNMAAHFQANKPDNDFTKQFKQKILNEGDLFNQSHLYGKYSDNKEAVMEKRKHYKDSKNGKVGIYVNDKLFTQVDIYDLIDKKRDN